MDKFYKAAKEEGKYGIPEHFTTFEKPFSLRLWDIIVAASYTDVKRACENIIKNEYHFQFTYLKHAEDRDSKLQQYQFKVADIVAILTMPLEELENKVGLHKDLMNQWLYGHIHGEYQFSLDSRSSDYYKSKRIKRKLTSCVFTTLTQFGSFSSKNLIYDIYPACHTNDKAESNIH